MSETEASATPDDPFRDLSAVFRNALACWEAFDRAGVASEAATFVIEAKTGRFGIQIHRNGRSILVTLAPPDVPFADLESVSLRASEAFIAASAAEREALWKASVWPTLVVAVARVVNHVWGIGASRRSFLMEGDDVYLPAVYDSDPEHRSAAVSIEDLAALRIPDPILRMLVAHAILGEMGFGWWEVSLAVFDECHVGLEIKRGPCFTRYVSTNDPNEPHEIKIDGVAVTGDALEALLVDCASAFRRGGDAERALAYARVGGDDLRAFLKDHLTRAGFRPEERAKPSDLN